MISYSNIKIILHFRLSLSYSCQVSILFICSFIHAPSNMMVLFELVLGLQEKRLSFHCLLTSLVGLLPTIISMMSVLPYFTLM